MSNIYLSTAGLDVLDSPGSSVFDLPVNTTSPPSIRVTSTAQGLRRDSRKEKDTSQTSRYILAHDAAAPVANKQHRDGLSFLVISGGTGGNEICSAFPGDKTCYVLPVSDDGGSSSEIIRVLGGPSIGDIRSRLIRLIPPSPEASPLEAIRKLLAYRLPANFSQHEARDEWRDIVEGRSSLWNGIPHDRKETIRGFLVHFESELLKRSHKNFSFQNGSIGNYFLAAAQGFFRSLPSAIFLFSSITSSRANIVPVIVTNHTVTIAAELGNGERLVGQCEISHPVAASITIGTGPGTEPLEPWPPVDDMGEVIMPGNNVMFEAADKENYQPLGSRILRLFYINTYGIEIHPSPNSDFIHNLGVKDVLVYSCGSLWTSIIPCLALRGVADGIARSRSLRAKILLLNSQNDRETDGYTAADYILAIARTLNTSHSPTRYGIGDATTTYPISAFITDLVYIKNTTVEIDVAKVTRLGVRCTEVEPGKHGLESTGNTPKFDAENVRRAIEKIVGASSGCDS